MKIGIRSDIHHRLDLFCEAFELMKKNAVQAVCVAGDIVQIQALKILQESALPTYMVLGNNDERLEPFAKAFDVKTEPYYFELEGVTFKMAHLPFFLNPDTNVIVYGHTHIQKIDKTSSALYINPGEICAREKPQTEFVILEIAPTKFMVETFYRPLNSQWETQKYEFAR